MIERLDVKHLLKSSNKQYWFGRLDNLGKYLDRIAAYFSGSVRRHRFAALVLLTFHFLFVKLREREGQRVDLGRSLKGHL